MQDGEFFKYAGIDATKWAESFCKTARGYGYNVDEIMCIGWFANAIQSGIEEGYARKESELKPEV